MEQSKYRKGVISKVEYLQEWLNPINNKFIYYHVIQFEDGQTGTVGVMEQFSPRIGVGEILLYEIDEKLKIKIQESSHDKHSELKPKEPESKKPALKKDMKKESTSESETNTKIITRIKGQEGFLGYSWSYAKDLIIAGKSMKDVEELNKVARYIYNEIGKMLMNE
jgi:hypothetical protein